MSIGVIRFDLVAKELYGWPIRKFSGCPTNPYNFTVRYQNVISNFKCECISLDLRCEVLPCCRIYDFISYFYKLC